MLPPDYNNESWERTALEYLVGESINTVGRAWVYSKDDPCQRSDKETCTGTQREPHEEIDHDRHSSCPVCTLKNEIETIVDEGRVKEKVLMGEIENLELGIDELEEEVENLKDENSELKTTSRGRIGDGEDTPNIGRKIRA